MRVCLIVPSRGGIEPLKEILPLTVKNSTLSNTKIVVGFDRDEFRESWLTEIQTSDKILACVEKREDSLGAKYNRCAQAHEADLYLIGKDHIALSYTMRAVLCLPHGGRVWVDFGKDDGACGSEGKPNAGRTYRADEYPSVRVGLKTVYRFHPF